MRSHAISKYLIFTKSGMQTTLAYRGQVALWFIGGMINATLTGLLWWAVFSFADGDTINGYTFPQMLMYMILATVVGEMIYTDTMFSIIDDVHHGLIGMRLMKPVNYHAQLGFTAAGSFVARLLIIGIPITAVATPVLVFGFGLGGIVWYNALLFFGVCALSMLLTDALSFLFGQLAFRTHAMFGISSMFHVVMLFLSGATVPIALFPEWAQSALAFTPFPSIVSLPVRLFLGEVGWAELAISVAAAAGWIIALNVLGELLYKLSVRKVVVFGG